MGIVETADWMLLILTGCGVLIWGWWIWHDPSHLHRGPGRVRTLQVRFLLWRTIRSREATRLTDREIKKYAARTILGGCVMVLGGVIGLAVTAL